MNPELVTLDPTEFALRCATNWGSAAFMVYIVPPAGSKVTSREVQEELLALGMAAEILEQDPVELVRTLRHTQNAAIVNATAYSAADWQVLDRQRSRLQRDQLTIFIVSPSIGDDFTRHAPNLASWLGAEVFALTSDAAQRERDETSRALRLAALQQWSGRTDQDVVAEAEAGTLPRDPEYAEWLVLLGRGDLLDA